MRRGKSPGVYITDDGKTKPSNPKNEQRPIDHGHTPYAKHTKQTTAARRRLQIHLPYYQQQQVQQQSEMTNINNLDSSSSSSLFVEIRKKEEGDLQPTFVEAYVAIIPPQQCGPLIKRLGRELPLVGTGNKNNDDVPKERALDLSHLKRVKKVTTKETDHHKSSRQQVQEDRSTSTDDDADTDTTSSSTSPFKKKQKTDNQKPMHLEILLREVEYCDQLVLKRKTDNDSTMLSTVELLQQTWNVPNIEKRMVPGRPPESHSEWQDFQNNYWPTNFFAEKSKEHLEKQLQLSQAEIDQMIEGMQQAIKDSSRSLQQHTKKKVGCVIMNPLTGKVVSTSSEECEQQQYQTRKEALPNNNNNPLATSILLGIQGISRQERNKAISDGMESSKFQKGQYLCTGYDVYATQEPTPFEAMALVHSRIKRLVFGTKATNGGGITTLNIHDLPSTNHHYRAFVCCEESSLWKECQNI